MVFDARHASLKNKKFTSKKIKVVSGAQLLVLNLDDDELSKARKILYIHINVTNQKCYIGQTINTSKYRFENGRGYKGQKALSSAISEYGWSNFRTYVICFADKKSTLDKLEKECITYIGGHKHNGNYNMSPGGDIVSDNGKPIVAVYLPTMKETNFTSGSAAARRLKIQMDIPADVANKLSKRNYHGDWYFYYKGSKPDYPKVWGGNARVIKFRQSKGRPIVFINLKNKNQIKEYPSAIEASEKLGCSATDIYSVCAGRQKSVKGYFCFYKDEPKEIPSSFGYNSMRITKSIPVWSLNLNDKNAKLIKHLNQSEASKYTGVLQSSVSSVLSEKRKSENGYWFTTSQETTPPKFGEWGKSSVAKHKEIPVIATCIKTGKSFKYKSAKKASEILGVHRSMISKVISDNDTKQSAGGYYWQKLNP